MGQIGLGALESEIGDVEGAEHLALHRSDVSQQDMTVLADGANPAQAGDWVRLGRHAGQTHPACHLGHGQDQDLLRLHVRLSVRRQCPGQITDAAPLQMDQTEIRQVVLPPLGYQPPVAMIGCRLSAQETRTLVPGNDVLADGRDMPLFQQAQKGLFVG